ncbi:hypothetical protein [Nonomuraea gerenzanensis]|uniref:Uncharacterized protein n=1 Tax=Nonomuraea gerenzanensis TaxID=93944 RepID=A0A1M4EK05_9ACTN|nr:hypothetical protein [Nonomuraea gerenzanensis]SBO99180.1 hypothetical protein BN4615_P8696 [Nonomuraea gerenzanensis]
MAVGLRRDADHGVGLNPTGWKRRALPGLFLGEPPFVLSFFRS